MAVVLAVLLVAELAVRLAAGHLPSPQRWSAPEIQHKADQLAGWTAHNARPDVVIFGASMADDGLDPAVIDRALGKGRAAYNASLVGTPLDSIVLWAERHVVPSLHPDVVVASCTDGRGDHRRELLVVARAQGAALGGGPPVQEGEGAQHVTVHAPR